jgi:UDP-N-acetylglucosamine 2-epimerase
MGLGARCIPLSANTSMEALAYSLSMPAPRAEEGGPYALVTVHRMENIFSRQRLGMVLDLVAHISRRMKVVFVQHQPTINRQKRYGLQRRLEGIAGLRLHRIMSHRDFLHLLEGCEFVVTDGGSIQEESACLGKPCLLLRRRTERQDGLGQNVAIGGCDLEAGLRFLEEFPRLRRPPARMPEIRPSEQIVAYLSSATPWD